MGKYACLNNEYTLWLPINALSNNTQIGKIPENDDTKADNERQKLLNVFFLIKASRSED